MNSCRTNNQMLVRLNDHLELNALLATIQTNRSTKNTSRGCISRGECFPALPVNVQINEDEHSWMATFTRGFQMCTTPFLWCQNALVYLWTWTFNIWMHVQLLCIYCTTCSSPTRKKVSDPFDYTTIWLNGNLHQHSSSYFYISASDQDDT